MSTRQRVADRVTQRNAEGKLITYVRIVKLLHTPVSGVKTAVLDCGTAEMEAVRQRRVANV